MRSLPNHLAICDSISAPGISAAVLHSLTEPAPSVYCPMSEYNGSENESVSSVPGCHEAEIGNSDA